MKSISVIYSPEAFRSGYADVSAHNLLFAFVTISEDVSADVLRQFCRDGIADYKVPWKVAILPELPRTLIGKFTRCELLATAAVRVAESESASVR